MRFGGINSKETVSERLKRPLVDRSKLPRKSDNKQTPSSYPLRSTSAIAGDPPNALRRRREKLENALRE